MNNLTHLNTVNGVIFDLDGTLVSSSLDFSLMRKQIGCPHHIDILSFLSDISNTTVKRHAKKVIEAHEMADARTAQWLPGAHELLSKLKCWQIPIAIVTRNSINAAKYKLGDTAHDIDMIICRDAHPAKPAPDGLLAVAQHWNKHVNNLIYVGDYKYDLQAANAANMRGCLVRWGQDHDFAHLANICCDNLHGLQHWINQHRLQVPKSKLV